MPHIDARSGEVVIRIVYDGAPEAGKTTNVAKLGTLMSLQRVGAAKKPGTTGDRTEFFDWLDFAGGYLDGRRVRCQLVSVPGQSSLLHRRRYLLEKADAIVFVADSRRGTFDGSIRNFGTTVRMVEKLAGPVPVGVILQANKQDLPGALTPPEVAKEIGTSPIMPVIGSVASRGDGVMQTFILAVRLATDRVRALLVGDDVAAMEGHSDTPEDLFAAMLELEKQMVRAAGIIPAGIGAAAGPDLPSIEIVTIDDADVESCDDDDDDEPTHPGSIEAAARDAAESLSHTMPAGRVEPARAAAVLRAPTAIPRVPIPAPPTGISKSERDATTEPAPSVVERDQVAREAARRHEAARRQVANQEAEIEAAWNDVIEPDGSTREHDARPESAAREQVAREQAAREQAARERLEREQAERERLEREQAAREQAERERLEREQAERERLEREEAAREQAARDQAERERLEHEQAERERAERERLEREQAERERAERERLEREQAEREQIAREQAEREQAAREQAARERQEREHAAHDHAERERVARTRVERAFVLRPNVLTEQDRPALPSAAEIGSGHVWPPVKGRASIAVATSGRVSIPATVQPWAPVDAFELVSDAGWILHSTPRWVYDGEGDARHRLLAYVRSQISRGGGIPEGRTLAVAKDGTRWRLWLLTPSVQPIAQRVIAVLDVRDASATTSSMKEVVAAMRELRELGMSGKAIAAGIAGLAVYDRRLTILPLDEADDDPRLEPREPFAELTEVLGASVAVNPDLRRWFEDEGRLAIEKASAP